MGGPPPSAYIPVVEGERDPGDAAPPSAAGPDAARWHVRRRARELRVHHGAGAHHPQYAALHLDSSYLRLTPGPASGWGTSLLLLPSFWSGGRLRQGAPVTAAWRADGPDLLLAVASAIGGLVVSIDLRLAPPGAAGLTARVAARVTGSASVDDRPGEAFKIVTLSSMRVSPTAWDASAAEVGGRPVAIPSRGWIGHPPAIATTLGLRGGTSAWESNAPTIGVALDRPLACVGWVSPCQCSPRITAISDSPSADPNDDNVCLWAGSDALLPAWSYTVTAARGPPGGTRTALRANMKGMTAGQGAAMRAAGHG